jgi:hypothetical protein
MYGLSFRLYNQYMNIEMNVMTSKTPPRPRYFKVKAQLTFPDGILPGQIKVFAVTQSEAAMVAKTRLAEIWNGAGLMDISILEVK